VNPELFKTAHPHVQAEYRKLMELNGALAGGLELAVRSYLNRRPATDLPGATLPGEGAPVTEWLSYFVAQGAAIQERNEL
jgi:hypothetical protein